MVFSLIHDDLQLSLEAISMSKMEYYAEGMWQFNVNMEWSSECSIKTKSKRIYKLYYHLVETKVEGQHALKCFICIKYLWKNIQEAGNF